MTKTLQLTKSSTIQNKFPSNIADLIRDRKSSHPTPNSARKRARINLSKILFQRNVSAIEEESMTKTEKAFFYRTAAEVAPDNPGFMTAKTTSRAKGSAKTAKS